MSEHRTPRYTRIVIFIHGQGFSVAGYSRGAFHPEGTFPDANGAISHALTLPVRDERNPINLVRGAA